MQSKGPGEGMLLKIEVLGQENGKYLMDVPCETG